MFEILDFKEGMKIEKPCVVRGMPIETYHKMPALSNSGLKTLLDCPAKYYYKYLSGEYSPKDKPHFKIGKAVHCYLLEGREVFESIYWINPFKKLLKEEKIALLEGGGYSDLKKLKVAELDELLFQQNNIKIKDIELDQNELNQIVCMARAALNNKKCATALQNLGEPELSLFWYENEHNLWFKARPDFMPYNPIFVPDYKTAKSVRPENFYRSFIDYGYHIQGAMYRRAIKAILGLDVKAFYFIAQEKEAPYITQIYNPALSFFFWGDKAINNAVSVYKKCKEEGIWGGYSDKIIELTTEPAPDYLAGNYDRENGIIYSPPWIDKMFEKYEV